MLTASVAILVHRSSYRGRSGREARMEVYFLVPSDNGCCVLYLHLAVGTCTRRQ